MCRSLNRRHRTNPPGRYVAECRKVGKHRPKSRGRDRRPQGECSGLAADPAPVPAGASQGNGEMAKQHSARWIAGPSVRANNRKRGSSRRPPGTTSCPKQRSTDRSCGRTLGDGRDCCAGQGTEPPGTDGFLRRFLAPYYHRESIRSTTVAIGWEIEQHSRTGFDSASIFLEN